MAIKIKNCPSCKSTNIHVDSGYYGIDCYDCDDKGNNDTMTLKVFCNSCGADWDVVFKPVEIININS